MLNLNTYAIIHPFLSLRGDNDGTSVSKKPKVVSSQDEDEDEGIGVAGNIFMEAIDMTTAG